MNFKILPKLKILLKQFFGSTPLKQLNRILWNFEVMKDIMCKICNFTGNADLIFLRSNLYPFWTLAKIILCNSDETGFLSDCPSLMLGIAIRCIQLSQAMLEHAHSFILRFKEKGVYCFSFVCLSFHSKHSFVILFSGIADNSYSTFSVQSQLVVGMGCISVSISSKFPCLSCLYIFLLHLISCYFPK